MIFQDLRSQFRSHDGHLSDRFGGMRASYASKRQRWRVGRVMKSKSLGEWIRLIGLLVIISASIQQGLHAQIESDQRRVVGLSTGNDEERERPIRVERNLVYREVDGDEVRADLIRPAWDSDRGWPVVMMVHGGAWSAGDKWDLLDHGRELAQAGFVVVSINYRLAPKAKMETQVDDCLFAIGWIQDHLQEWKLDRNRFALWGYSAGAQLVSLIALKEKGLAMPVKAVVVGGTPADFSFVPEKSSILKHVFGATREQNSALYERYSPTSYLREDAPPFFLFHGDRDFLVPQRVGKKLHEQLVEIGAPSTFLSVENKGHLMTFLDRSARKKAIQFLNRHMESPTAAGDSTKDDKDPGTKAGGENSGTRATDSESQVEPIATRGDSSNA
ncbi:MAG: alpha/beta hydrolase fold domain-containing protein [Aureliella sp.]